MKQPTTDHWPLATDCFIAIDLGAGSGRVFLGSAGEKFLLTEIHRFIYPPRESDGHLRWDFGMIFAEIKTGLTAAGKRAKELNKTVYSLGVDSWAVDYGLLDENGNLLADPVCYRDSRTERAQENVFKIVPKDEIFDKTGIQFLPFNTIFQLFSETGLDRAATVLLLPDLINYQLTGRKLAEYTNATTTQLVNAVTADWDSELLERLDLDRSKLPEIIPAGTDLGFLKTEVARELNLPGVRVTAPATHDTGSAVAGLPLESGWAYISSGTWSLVGVELDKPLINEEVAAFNFTNEGGVFGTIRFLKNVMGLWILESCRREWELQGIRTDYATLLAEVEKIKGFSGFIFPDDERFLNPASMLESIAAQQRETGQPVTGTVAETVKVILDSLAFRYALVLETIEKLTGRAIRGVQIAGGGGKNDYLNRMTANACRKTVKAGLTEATVTGNILVQAIASGRFKDLAEARNYVAENIELKTFEPVISAEIEKAKADYSRVENHFVGP